MTSEGAATECFVYITLPGHTTAVTAGRFVLDANGRGNPLGRFVYGKSYLANPDALPIDPIELKLSQTTFETTRLNGVFGALRDGGPDYWGRRIIEKHAGKPRLGELDYLLESPDDRAGALNFATGARPPAPRRQFNKTLDLATLQRIAEALIGDDIIDMDADAVQVEELLLIATSMGGARPKTVVEDKEGLWIAKFNRPDDRWNNARVEHAMLELATGCGIDAANSRMEVVAGKDVLLVKRFDRQATPKGYTRARMISGLTLLRADETPTARDRWSYMTMVEEMRRVVADAKKDSGELFRRITFNALISNIDDHPRNHALIAKHKDWMLSPAYDLVPAPVLGRERRDLAMDCGDLGRYANAKNILSQHARFLLDGDEAKAVVTDMTERIRATWYDTVRAHGVTENDAEAIRGAFAYDGFSL